MTVALCMPTPATMPGYKNSNDLDEVQSLTSSVLQTSRNKKDIHRTTFWKPSQTDLNFHMAIHTQGHMERSSSQTRKQSNEKQIPMIPDQRFPQSMLPPSAGLFSFSQTEPSADLLSSSLWGTTTDGPQNCPDFPDNGSSHSGEAEEYIITSGQTTPRGSRIGRSRVTDSTWTAAGLTPVSTTGGQAMSRLDSSRSNGSSLSQTSSHVSNMDMRGNASAFRTGSQAPGTMVGVDSCLLLDADANALPQVYWPGYQLGSGLDTDQTFSVSDASPLHVVPSQMQFGPDTTTAIGDNASPSSWVSFPGSISRTSSPATIDDAWLQTQQPLSPPNSSPEIPCQSPSSLDFNGHVKLEDMTNTLPENLALPPAIGNRRDGETARNHDLYKNAVPKEDGLFHCPWEGDPSCNHKPEKLKCNYDKFVDSHLKPYRCKAEACEGARFSSTACLLRHEREAHGLHGHGEKPFLCQYEGCERGVPGNGFPRQWNLKDHMKRVHNDHGSSGGSPPGGNAPVQQPSVSAASKSRKRKTEGVEPQISSRKSSQKNMTPKETKQQQQQQQQPAVKPLLEQWMDHRRVVEDLIRGLNKPQDARTMQQLSEMQKHLSVMSQMSSEFNSNANPRSQPDLLAATMPGQMGFVTTG